MQSFFVFGGGGTIDKFKSKKKCKVSLFLVVVVL